MMIDVIVTETVIKELEMKDRDRTQEIKIEIEDIEKVGADRGHLWEDNMNDVIIEDRLQGEDIAVDPDHPYREADIDKYSPQPKLIN